MGELLKAPQPEQDVFSRVNHAIIIAGGRGTRLAPLTDNTPKCLVEVAGKPIVDYQLESLIQAGVEHVTFALGHLRDQVVEYIGDGSQYGITPVFSLEEEALGTGGATRKAFGEIPGDWDDIIITNGDSICDVAWQDVLTTHRSRPNTLATVITLPEYTTFGIVETNEDNEIIGFKEKPTRNINTGMYIFSRKIKRHLPYRGNQEETTFEKLSKKQYRRRFLGHSWEGFFININTREDLKRAEEWVTREEKRGDLASDDIVRYSIL